MKAFEYLLKDLGWKLVPGKKFKYYNPNEPAAWQSSISVGYYFISQIEIEVWGAYEFELVDLACDSDLQELSLAEIIHNAPLEHRVLAHARVRGYKD